MTTDVLINNDKGYFDFEWTPAGDISMISSLDTYILMCLFEEARGTPDEILKPHLRRGWIGNETTPTFEQGSKAWQFEQERMTGTVLAELGVVIRNSLQPLIDDGIASSVEVETPFIRNGSVAVYINLGRGGSPTERRFFELWDNTGSF